MYRGKEIPAWIYEVPVQVGEAVAGVVGMGRVRRRVRTNIGKARDGIYDLIFY